jgi:uncharacterized membrane protein
MKAMFQVLRPLFALMFLSVVALAFLTARVTLTNGPAFPFLVWNLTLAWIPCLSARAFTYAHTRGLRTVAFALALVALAFLPNTFYIVTDLTHLIGTSYHAHIIDGAYMSLFAATSWLLGLFTIDDLARAVATRWGRVAAAASVVAMAIASGFGVYLGRYLRFNSWDVVSRPGALAWAVGSRVVNPGEHPRTLVVTAVFAVLIAATWFARDLSATQRVCVPE